MLIHHFLENAAERYPAKEAVYCSGMWMTYSEIQQKVQCLAAFFIEQGIKRGDRIGLLYENCFDYIISYFGILKAGCVVVALNTETTDLALNYCIRDCGVVALVISEKFKSQINKDLFNQSQIRLVVCNNPLVENVAGLTIFNLQSILSSHLRLIDVRVISIDLAAIVYTSGSTGKPKGVMLTHQNICDNTMSIVQYLKLTDRDRMMVVLPFFYIYGNSLLLTHFCAGGSIVIDNRFAYPNVVIQAMKDQCVTGFAGVPSTFILLLHKSNIRAAHFDDLRYVTQAGGAMAPTVQKQVMEVFAPAKLYVMYGATEAAPRLTYLEPDMLIEKSGSIGKAVPNVEVFVADENGGELPFGITGEIVARGSNIMNGYWNDPEETAKVIRNGLYFTGDLGIMDQDGYIFIVGRTKDIIKVGGNRVSAKEVEEALLSIPGICEAVVIGVEDPILSEAIKAFIVTVDGKIIDYNHLRELLAKQIAHFKIPKHIEYRTELPKNKSGKYMKDTLTMATGNGNG